MSETGQAAPRCQALRRIAAVVRAFAIERRLEDEPAHHAKALERLAEPEDGR